MHACLHACTNVRMYMYIYEVGLRVWVVLSVYGIA